MCMGMVAVGGVRRVVGGRGAVAVAGRAARATLYRAGAAKAGEGEVLAWSSFPAPRQSAALHVGAGAEVPRRGVVRGGGGGKFGERGDHNRPSPMYNVALSGVLGMVGRGSQRCDDGPWRPVMPSVNSAIVCGHVAMCLREPVMEC